MFNFVRIPVDDISQISSSSIIQSSSIEISWSKSADRFIKLQFASSVQIYYQNLFCSFPVFSLIFQVSLLPKFPIASLLSSAIRSHLSASFVHVLQPLPVPLQRAPASPPACLVCCRLSPSLLSVFPLLPIPPGCAHASLRPSPIWSRLSPFLPSVLPRLSLRQ